MAKQFLEAVEAATDVHKAIEQWRERFFVKAEKIAGLGPGTAWHPRMGMWGHFGKWKRDDGSDRYWIPFGFSRVRLRQNMIVEINPPAQGRSEDFQGVLAVDDSGCRWVMHKGRMSISGAQITAEKFDEAASTKRRTVVFSDKAVADCHPVANIDASATEVQDQTARFVTQCHRIRLFHSLGPEVAKEEARVEAAENSPELTGTFLVRAQEARVARRYHGDVWHSLTKSLDRMGVGHTNSRVGRWGPDLRTVGKNRTLFEIKVTTTAADLPLVS